MSSFPNWQDRLAAIDHHYNPLPPPLPWWAWIRRRRRRRHRAQMAASLAALAKRLGGKDD